MASELKPCPYCRSVHTKITDLGGDAFYVGCENPDCLATGPTKDTRKAALDAYARRPISVEEVARAGKRASTTTDSGTATQILERGLRALGIEVEDGDA